MTTNVNQLMKPKKPTASKGGQVSDQELMQRFARQRDEAAFEELVKRYGGLVQGTARRIVGDHQTAEDVLQATFLVLARKARSVPWKQTIAPWLYTTAYRLACKARQRRMKLDRRSKPLATRPDDTLQWAETCQALDSELMQLGESTRAALILCYLEGKTRDEAAELLGLSLATLKRRLEQGRHLLRDRLTQRGITLSTASLGLMLAQTQLEAASLQAVMQAVMLQAPRTAVAMLVPGSLLLGWMYAAVVLLGIGLVGVSCWYALPAAEATEVRGMAMPVITPRHEPADPVDTFGDPLPAGAIRRFGTVRWRPGQMMVALSYSTNQKYVVGWLKGYLMPQGMDRLVYWDRATGKEALSLEMPRNNLLTMRWLPDGKLLALTRFAHRYYHLCAFEPGKETTFPDVDGNSLNTSGMGDIRCADISPDGKWIITGKRSHDSNTQPIELWPATSNTTLSNPITLGNSTGHGMFVQFSGDGKKAIALCRKQGGYIQVPGQRVIGQPAGQLMEGAWEEQATMLVFDVESRKQLRTFKVKPPTPYVDSFPSPHRIAVNHDGSMVYLGDEQGSVHCYETATGRDAFIWNLELPANKRFNDRKLVSCVYLSPDGKLLFAAGEQGIIRSLNTENEQHVRNYQIDFDQCSHLAITQDGQQLAAANAAVTAQIVLLDTKTGERQNSSEGHTSYVSDMALLPGDRMKTLSFHRDMITWDLKTGKQLSRQEMRMSGGYTGMLSFTRDMKGIFGNVPELFRLGYLDLTTNSIVPCTAAVKEGEYQRFLATTGSGVFYLDSLRKLIYWNASTKSLLQTYSIQIPTLQSTPQYAQFSPDQSRLAVVSSGLWSGKDDAKYRCGALSLHEAKTGKLLKHWLTPAHDLKHVSYTADGKHLLVYGITLGKAFVPETPADQTLALDSDASMALLEAETGKVVQVYIPPTKASWAPSAIRWNEDGQTLATAFSDGTIAVYDRNAAKPRQVLRGHRGGISCLRFYGEKLLSASDDGTCLMWELHR